MSDELRIEELFDELFAVAHRAAWRIVGDVGTAEDVAAETPPRPPAAGTETGSSGG